MLENTSHLVTVPLVRPPDDISVNVAYYDDEERKAITQTLGNDILGGSSKTLVVPTPDFCTYYLYYKLRSSLPGYSSHKELAKKWYLALCELDGQLGFANDSIRLIQLAGSNRGTTERFGEAIGLSVASRLHGLHDGDWARIPETNKHKTFDFDRPLASDGSRFISIETKGSSVADNSKRTDVSHQKGSIKQKKPAAVLSGSSNSVCYGTIGVLDDRQSSVAQCWLVDPPADMSGDPYRFKVLARLEYIASWISFLGNRSQLASSLWTRLASLESLSDVSQFAGGPLRNGARKEFSQETFSSSGGRNQWFASKSVVVDEPVGGAVFVVSKDALFYMAIQEELVVLAASQDFDRIARYSFPAKVAWKSVECVVPIARFQREFQKILGSRAPQGRRVGGHVRLILQGQIFYCQSGVVFGVLPINQDEHLKQ